jgi:hypothetical protein
MGTRRNFIKQLTTAGLMSTIPGQVLPASWINLPANGRLGDKIWACLIHLSFNMWEDHDRFRDSDNPNLRNRIFDPSLRLSEPLWDDMLKKMSNQGMNMIVIDLGDAVKYRSHPEIAVKNAWSTTRLKNELKKMRALGLEPIPKLNFSTGHDTWLGEYSRMVSTKRYYEVCRNLIAEVIDLFDKPRFFHLGYDEEVALHQRFYDYTVIRQNDLWWKDFYFFVNEVEKGGSRSWIWSDYVWHNPELFYKKMPKEVLQSNWYYGASFEDKNKVELRTYEELEARGYDQVPTGGYYSGLNKVMYSEESIKNTVQFCKERISDQRLLGFMQTNWRPTVEVNRNDILKSIGLIGSAKQEYIKK